MQETLRHKKAFEYYLGLGEDRSLASVAVQCNVSARAVAKWSKEFRWQERLKSREDKIGQKVEQSTDKTLADLKAQLLKDWQAAEARWVEKFNDEQIEPKDYKDLETATKNILLLLGGATERVEIVTFAAEIAELARKTITNRQDLEAFVHGVHALASTGQSLN